jgi:hypothetical protein
MVSIEPAVTWIKVEKPTFDLVGVVLGSFRLAGALLLVALALGLVFGGALILSRRRSAPGPLDEVSLHLNAR